MAHLTNNFIIANTTITGPVLIYSDELPVDPSANTIGDPNRPGALIMQTGARVSWHYTRGQIVRDATFSDTFKQIRTGEGVIPSGSAFTEEILTSMVYGTVD